MATHGVLAFIVLLGCGSALAQSTDKQATDKQEPASQNAVDGEKSGAWLFPVEKLNQKLPSWIRFAGEYRTRVESSNGIRFTNTEDTYLLSRFRFDVTIQPAKWLTFYAQTQDSHVFFNQHIPEALPYQNPWDIRQGYVQFGSKENWADLVVGRQVLAFGSERVIGPSDWVNAGRSYDAVRFDVHQAGYQVSLFASSVVVGSGAGMDHHIQGNNLHGIYGSLNAIPGATLEPYVLWRLAPGNVGLPETANRGHLNEVTTGLRLAGTFPADFDYEIEMDRQTGSLGTASIHAWAGYWSLGRTFRDVAATPRIFIESTYASGSKNPNGPTWGTFDQLYPSNHDKLDFADQVARKNIQQVRGGVEETIARKWKLRQTYEGLWLATTHDALYASSGTVTIPANPRATSRFIGQEVDLIAQYKVNQGITAGFGYARLFAGRFVKANSQGKDFIYPFEYLTYRF
jgi:hypothetical protein